MKRGGILIFLFLFIGIAWPQSPPGWVVQGNLPDASGIRDMIQLPWNPNVVLAVGYDRNGWYHASIWKSTNKGNTWSYVFWPGSNDDYFRVIDVDSSKFRIWALGDLTFGNMENSLYYSLDEGDNWTDVPYPNALDSVGYPRAMKVVNSKVYYGGWNNGSNQIKLYRYNTTNPNPSNWNWEKVTTFNNADAITQFLQKGQELYIFVRNSNHTKILVYKLDLTNDQLSFVSNMDLTWVHSCTVKDGNFYVGGNKDGVARIYKSPDATTWTKIGEWQNSSKGYLSVYTMLYVQDTLLIGLYGFSDDGYMLYKTSDDGTNWESCFTPDGAQVACSLRMVDNVLMLGTGYTYGDVFRATWNVSTGGVYVYGPTWVYNARTHNGAVYFTTNYDYGEVYKMPDENTVNIFKTFSDATTAYDINWFNDTIFVAINGANKIKKSPDNGTTWDDTFKPDGANNVLTIFNRNNTELLIGTEPYGDVFRSNYQYDTGGVYVYGPTWVYQAKNHNGEIYFTTNYNYGEIYKMPNENTANVWKMFTDATKAYDIEWYNDTIMVAIDGANLIKRSSDGGSTWENTFKPDGASHVYSIKYFPTKGLFIGTDPYGDVFKANYKYDTGGVYINGPTWVYQAKNHNGEIYFTTNYDYGEIYKMPSENTANVWKVFNDASKAFDIEWYNDTIMVAVNGANLIKRSSDGGSTWENTFKPDGANSVLSLKYLSSDKMIIGTEPYGDVFLSNYQYQTGGTLINGPTWVYDAQFCGDKGLIATNFDNGEIWKTEDGGQTWTNLTGFTQPWSQVYSLVAFGHTIYAGTNYNGDVYVSHDDGQTWQPTGDLAGATDVYSLYLSTESRPNRLFAGTGPNGDVFLTDTTVMTLQAPDIVQEPEFTEGTENTVFCHNNGLDGYQFEAAYDSLFQAVVELSPVVTDTFYTFQNLQDGVKYFYRVYGKSCQYTSLPSGYTFSTQDALPPTFMAEQPQDSSWLTDTQPLIGIKYHDSASGVQTSSVVLKLDGNTITGIQVTDSMVTYQPTGDLSQGMHTVEVSVQDKVGYSASFSWHFGIDTAPPQPVALISPVDGIFINHSQVTFTWKSTTDSLSGVNNYELIYANDSTFQNNVHVVSVTDTSHTITLADTIYYWKIRAIDKAGNSSESAVRHFEVDTHTPVIPQLLSPLAGSWLTNPEVTFQWEQVSRFTITAGKNNGLKLQTLNAGQGVSIVEGNRAAPVHYIIHIFNSSGTILLDTVTTNQYTATLTEGEYFWKIKAYDEAGNNSAWSDSSQFGIDLTKPGTVQLLTPIDGALLNSQTIAFSWSSAHDNLSGIQNYVMYIDDNPSFSSPDSITSTDTSVTYTTGFDTTLYWKVRAYDRAGLPGDWSTVNHLTIDSQPPATPQLIYPISAQWINRTTVNFQWSAVSRIFSRNSGGGNYSGIGIWEGGPRDPGFGNGQSPYNRATPVHYIIEVKMNGTTVIYDTTSSNQYSGVLGEGTYQWRIKAYDEAGNESAWSSMQTFGVDITPPGVVPLLSPPNNAILNTSSVTLQWQAGSDTLSGIAEYWLQVSTSNNFVGADTLVVHNVDTTVTVSDTTYFWRVKALDQAGLEGNWSEIRQFTVDSQPPQLPQLIYPILGEWVTNSTVTLQWTAVSRANPAGIGLPGNMGRTNRLEKRNALNSLQNNGTIQATPVQYVVEIKRNGAIVVQDTVATNELTAALGDGAYSWRVLAFDAAGNESGWTAYETFGIDLQAPQLLSCEISPDTVSTDTVTFTLTFSETGSGLDPNTPPTVQFMPNGGSLVNVSQTSYNTTNGIWVGQAQIPAGTNEGTAVVFISDAADLAGNVMTPNSDYSFLIDQTPPAAFTLIAPDSGIWLNNRTPLFVWHQSSDALSGLSHYDFYLNDVVNVGNLAPADTSTLPASPLADGAYNWKVHAYDAAGNTTITETWTVKIDSTPPIVTITYPQNGDTIQVGLLTIKGTAQDISGNFQGIGVDTVFVSTDDGATWSGVVSDSGQFALWSFQWMVPHKGTYTIKAYGRDMLGTAGTPGLGITVLVPNSAPVLVSPIPDTTFKEDTDSVLIAQSLNQVFSDVDGDPLTFAVTSTDTNLTVWLEGDTSLWATPAPDYFGQVTVIVSADDGDGGIVFDTVLVKVSPVNDPPMIVNLPDSVVFANDSSATLDMSQYAYDIDTPDSLLSWMFQPDNDSLLVSYNDTTKILKLTAPGFIGQVVLHCRVVDDSLAYAEDSIIVYVTYPLSIDRLSELGIPKTYELFQNYPNPFNPTTTIRYGIPKTTHVLIEVYNILGQRVATLVNERKYPGYYFVKLDGRSLGSGLYFYRLKTDEFDQVKKMLLVK